MNYLFGNNHWNADCRDNYNAVGIFPTTSIDPDPANPYLSYYFELESLQTIASIFIEAPNYIVMTENFTLRGTVYVADVLPSAMGAIKIDD